MVTFEKILKSKGYISPLDDTKSKQYIDEKKKQRNIALFYVIDQWHIKNPNEGLTDLGAIIPTDKCEKAHQTLSETLNEFYSFSNTIRANYIPCLTPVGHATLSSGQNPKDHQIIGREWYIENGQTEVGIQHLIDWLVLGEPNGLGFPEFMDEHNLCREIGGVDWFKIVCAAKDFIPFIVGGNDADIQLYLYNREDQENGKNKKKWELHIRCPKDPSLIDNKLQKKIEQKLKVIDQDAHYITWDSQYQSHTYELPNYNPWRDIITVDIFIANIMSDLFELFLESGRKNLLIFQSFWSTDRIGHKIGPETDEYWETLSVLIKIIADQINWLKTIYEKISGIITTDHGGRSISSKLTVEWNQDTQEYQYIEYNNRNNIIGQNRALYQVRTYRSQDLHYWYETQREEDSPVGIYRENYEDYDRFPVPDAIMQESFQVNNRPEKIEIPINSKFFYQFEKQAKIYNGFHGASVSNVNSPALLNAADYIIPYIFFTPQNDHSKSFEKPTFHKDLRRLFFSSIEKLDIFTKNKNFLPNIHIDLHVGKRRLSLSGLVRQCLILKEFFRMIAKYIANLDDPQYTELKELLIKNLIIEGQNFHLSEGIQRLIINMFTTMENPNDISLIKFDNMIRMINTPNKIRYSHSEELAKRTLTTYFNIDQIRPEIEELKLNLKKAVSKEDVIEYLISTSEILLDTAASLDELLV